MVEMAQKTPTLARVPPARRMTYEEFLEWADEDTWAEWVNGEVQMVSPATTFHQLLKKFLVGILDGWVQFHGLGVILDAPFQMRLPNVPSGREPDILFVAEEHRARLKKTFLDGPADVVVEIISPESRLRDRGEKFAEYELGGVPEYWLLDPEVRRADFYRLAGDERYERIDLAPGGIYSSQVIAGFWLRVEWLWQDPLPPVLDVLRELKVI